jgi:hypothetical protein
VDKSVLAAMAGVAVGGVVAFLLGSMLHDAYPGLPDMALAWIGVLSWVALAFGILYVLHPWKSRTPITVARAFVPTLPLTPPAPPAGREKIKREAELSHAAYQEAKRLRIAELAVDPAKARYVDLMQRGDWWTDEQIAYHENSQATATCPHLQSVELAIRSAGIVSRLQCEPWYRGFLPLPRVRADCCINEPELRRRFVLAPSVQHVTGYQPERSEFDNPWAELRCGDCDSTIVLEHPGYPGSTTVWFPAPPAA